MVTTNGAAASGAATKKNRLSKVMIANLIVFVMVSSAFFVAVAAAATVTPKVWSNAQEYYPGETVVILGEGFLSGPVTITLSHWSKGVQDVNFVDIAMVGDDGKFRYDGYTAEAVEDGRIPVMILAYQDAEHQATGSFLDPPETEKIEGFTLEGVNSWTPGDTRGYNEGDSIPIRVYVPNNYGSLTITVKVAVDFYDTTKGYRVYGMDFLTRLLYTPDPPVPPWNTYTNMSGTPGWTPFSVDPTKATIDSAARMTNELESPNNMLLVWEFTMTFASASVEYAYVHFGAHLAVSNLNANPKYYGASFYPGSSLHGRFISVNGVDIGNKELPIPTRLVMTPPSMHITKVCNPAVVPLGGTVTFTIDMWNTGEADALNVVLLDTLPAVVTYVPGTAQYWTTDTAVWQAFRDPDSTNPTLNTLTWNIGTIRGTGKNNDGTPAKPVLHYKVMFSVQVNSDALPKTYTNIASITHTDSGGNTYGPFTATCSFDVVVVSFEKFADRECAAVGETITYWFIIRNPSMVTLTYNLWDPLFKPYDPADPLWAGVLPPKSVVIVDKDDIPALEHMVTAEDDDHLINTATVTVTDGNDVEITLVDSWEVDILHPAIVVEKTANMECAAENDIVTFTITVTNPTIETEMWYTVYDPLLAPIYGNPLWNGYLEPGQSETRTFDYLVPDIPVDPSDPLKWELVNEVRVDAHDYQYVAGEPWAHLHWVTAIDSVAVDIYHPAIEIEKWADKGCAAPGEVVKYFITVHNPTLDTPMDFQVSDVLLGGVLWGPGSVDMWGYPYWTLAPGEWVTFGGDITQDVVPNSGYVYLPALEYTVSGNEPTDPYENVATVVAWDPQDHYVAASSDGWNVDIRHVDIEAWKWGDKSCAAVGEEVVYSITVQNKGDTPLDFVITDSLLGVIWGYGTGIVGDKFGDPYWTLGPGEMVTFGGDPNGDIVWQDGYVYIAKMKYTITGLEDVDKDGMADDPLVNTASVFAWDNQYIIGDLWADLHSDMDESSWEVDVRHPSIYFNKYADKECAAVGEEVVYFIDVYNTGDTPLDFVITDSLLGVLWGKDTGITGDKFNDPYWTLQPGDWVTFGGDPTGDVIWQDGYVYLDELKYTITGEEDLNQDGLADDPLVNWAGVFSWDDQYVEGDEWAYLHIATGDDSWEVDVRHPGIYINKYADKSCAAIGEEVVYFIDVYNSGDTPMDFILTDDLLGTLWGKDTGITGDKFGDPYWTLAPGDWVTFGGDPTGDVVWQDGYVYLDELKYTITGLEDVDQDGMADDPLVNTASIFAWDDQYLEGDEWADLHSILASASWEIDVRHPDIFIYKYADKECAAVGEEVVYFIDVYNSGDTPLDFVLTDSLLGVIWGKDTGITGDMFDDPYWTLQPGDWVTFGGDPTGDIVWQDGYVYLDELKYTITGLEDVNQDGLADDPLVNTATVFAWDDQYEMGDEWADLHSITMSSSWEVDVRHPDIYIYKYADKECAAVGEEVVYFIDVWNTGDTPLDFVLTDVLLGTLWGYNTGITGDMFDDPYWTLGAGEWITFGGDPLGDFVYQDGYVYLDELRYTITGEEDLNGDGAADDPLVNTANVFAWDDQYVEGDLWADLHSVTGSSSWEIDVRHPAIYIYKYADKSCAAVGEEVVYFIDVYNPGDTTLDFILTDDLLGTLWGYGTGITGDMFDDPYWPLAPGEWITFGGDPLGDFVYQDGYVYLDELRYTITGNEDLNQDGWADDPLVNTASIFAWDDQYVPGDEWADLHSASGSSSWEIDVRHPSIYIYKYAGKECAAVGEEVVYFIDVYNSGDTPLDFILTDNLLGVIWGYGTGITGDMFDDPYWTLAPGDWVTFGGDPSGDWVWQDGYVYLEELRYTITGLEDLNGDGVADDPLVNTAGVFAWDDQYVQGDEWADLHSVYEEASWDVDVRHPSIYIYKYADKSCAAEGEEVVYFIDVWNSGDTPLDFILTDDLLGTLWGYGTGITGDMFDDPYWTLGVGEWITFGGDPLGDFVYQDGYVYLAELRYTITGLEDLDQDGLADDPLVNTASIFAWDDQYMPGDDWADLHTASGSSSWEIDVRHPAIYFNKSADKSCAAVGEEVVYYIDVYNTGDTPLDFVITDVLLGVIWGYGTGITGDMFGDPYWTLAPGDWVTFGGDPAGDVIWQDGYVYLASLRYTVTGDEDVNMDGISDDPLVNTAGVFAWDDQYVQGDEWAGLHSVYITDSWEIDVRHVEVEVLKWSDKGCAAVGEDVFFFIQVHNPTDTLLDFMVYDWMIGYVWGPGSVDKFGTPYWPLAPGETIVFGGDESQDYVPNNGYVYVPVLKYTILDTDSDPLMNFATAEVWDDQYIPGDEWSFLHYNYANSNEVWIDIHHIDVIVTKWADKTCAAVGEDVKYFIEVYNPTDTYLDFTLVDSRLGYLWGPGSVDMWGYSYWTLAPYEVIQFGGEESWDIEPNNGYVYLEVLDHTVNANDLDPLVNYATVTVWDNQYVPGDAWAYLHIKTVDSGEWRVDIRHPAIYLDKWADKTCAAVGEDITYYFYLENTGDITLSYELYDDLFGGLGATGSLAPGQSITYYYVHTVTDTEDVNGDGVVDDPLINTAWVNAWDDQYVEGDQWAHLHWVSAIDTFTVDIRHPEIEIIKTADKRCAEEGELVTYYITVRNTGDTPLDFVLTDPLLGTIWGYGTGIVGDMFGDPYWTLGVGESITFGGDPSGDWVWQDGYVYIAKMCYAVTGDEDLNQDGLADDPLTNTASVTAWDDQWLLDDQWSYLHIVSGSSSWTVDILHPMISIVKNAYPSEVMVGEWIIYEITVTNPSWDTSMDFILTDSMFGVLWGYGTGIVGDNFNDPYWTLLPGESVTFGGNEFADVVYQDGYVYLEILRYQAQDTDFPEIYNIATVEAWDYQLHYRYASDDATVIVYNFAHVTGYVYQDNDLNDNLIGPGDVGLFNWRVTLTGVDYFGNPVNRFVFSDVTGFYDFGDVVPGTYTVAEVLVEHPGWVNTGPVSYGFTLAGGEDKRFDFGNIQYGRITGVKWLDDHMNGYQDLAPWPEPGLEGWIIHCDGVLVNGDVVHLTTTTAADGSYSFENLLPGIYDVWEEVPAGEDPADWVAITPSIYEDVEIQSGWEVTCCKFGNVKKESICGWKFYDWNMNRVKDGEPGIEGWKITLVGWLNDGLFPFHPEGATQVGPITIETDENGVWCFTDLLPGVYVISEENRDGWYHTTPMSVTFWIASYHGVSQVKFGNVPMTKITGQKFFDKDMDGVMDLGEPGLGGWTITLEKEISPGVWNSVVTTVTDPTGAYEFNWVLPGKYRVSEVQQIGWYATSALPIEVVIPAYTISHQLLPGKVIQNIGNVLYGSISGYKFEDLIGPNGEYPNGQMDANEYGVGNWEIKLEGRQVNKVLVQRTVYTTNVGPLSDIGKYVFADLLPGVYWVNETLMEHWVPTTTCVAMLFLSAYPFWPVNMVQNFGNMHPVDPEMNFVLKAGTNMWSSPLQMQSEMRASELAAVIGSSCAKITKWNTTTKTWQHFIPGFTPVNSAKDFRLKNGEGYYVGVRVFTTFQLTGDLVSDSTVDLVAGANLVGYDTLRPMRASEFVNLVSLDGGKVMKISTLNENGQWQHFIPGFTPAGFAKDYTMTQGHSYLVFTTTGGVITFPAA